MAGRGGTKNDRGDFSFEELVGKVKEFFGRTLASARRIAEIDQMEQCDSPTPPSSNAAVRIRLAPSEKLEVSWQLRQTAWELAAAGVRARHSELSPEAVTNHVRALFLRASG